MSCWKLSYDESIVWNYSEEMQIGASSDCANICSRATFHARQNLPFTRPWSAQSCSTAQWDVGVDQKKGEPIARIWEESSPKDMRPENRKWFDSSNALNVTKTIRLRYAGHMSRRPEGLPRKALFRLRAKPNRWRYQGRPKSRWADGVNSRVDWTWLFLEIRVAWSLKN
jgi:hypothetical protein